MIMNKKIIVLTLSLLTITIGAKAQVEIVSSGSGTPYVVNIPGTFVLTPGLQVTFKSNVLNPVGATLDVSGSGAKSITKEGGATAIAPGDIKMGQIVTVAYDGSNWQIISATGSSVSIPTTYWNPSGLDIYNNNTGNVGIGTTAPSQKLEVNGGQIFSNWANPNSIPNVLISNWNSTSGPGYLNGTIGMVSIATSDAAENKYAIQGAAGGDGGSKYGIYGNAMGLGSNFGGYFTSSGGTNNYALYAVGNAAGTSNGYGTYSTVGGNGSGTTYGIYGQNSSSVTGASYAGYFENFNSTGSIIFGVRSSLTGNAGTTVTKFGMRSDVTGTASSNVGGYFRAVGGTTNHAIQLVDGSEANNRVLASDGVGMATWTDLSAISSGSTAWTRTTPNIYPTILTDNVGIGTSTPGATLHVYRGASNATAKIESASLGLANLVIDAAVNKAAVDFYKTGIFGGTMGYDITGNYLFWYDGTANSLYGTGGKIGVGTIPTNKFDVVNNTLNTTAKFTNTFSSTTQKVSIDASTTGGGAAANIGGNFSASLSTLSNYGIYTNANGGSGSKTGIYATASGAGTNIGGQFSATGGTNNYALIVPSAAGNVGIGTSTPSTTLAIGGDISYNQYLFTSLGTTYNNFPTAGNSYVRLTISNNTVLNGISSSATEDGKLLILQVYISGAFNLTINNQSTSALAKDRINNLTRGVITLTGPKTSVLTYIYSKADLNWILTSFE